MENSIVLEIVVSHCQQCSDVFQLFGMTYFSLSCVSRYYYNLFFHRSVLCRFPEITFGSELYEDWIYELYRMAAFGIKITFLDARLDLVPNRITAMHFHGMPFSFTIKCDIDMENGTECEFQMVYCKKRFNLSLYEFVYVDEPESSDRQVPAAYLLYQEVLDYELSRSEFLLHPDPHTPVNIGFLQRKLQWVDTPSYHVHSALHSPLSDGRWRFMDCLSNGEKIADIYSLMNEHSNDTMDYILQFYDYCPRHPSYLMVKTALTRYMLMYIIHGDITNRSRFCYAGWLLQYLQECDIPLRIAGRVFRPDDFSDLSKELTSPDSIGALQCLRFLTSPLMGEFGTMAETFLDSCDDPDSSVLEEYTLHAMYNYARSPHPFFLDYLTSAEALFYSHDVIRESPCIRSAFSEAVVQIPAKKLGNVKTIRKTLRRLFMLELSKQRIVSSPPLLKYVESWLDYFFDPSVVPQYDEFVKSLIIYFVDKRYSRDFRYATFERLQMYGINVERIRPRENRRNTLIRPFVVPFYDG